ncbi:MAG TPA: APC family permease [Gaiellaceae bacterium]|nr:APC family permease [Gaiellaceae bacterium]
MGTGSPLSNEAPTRLARRLGPADAIVIGLGSMIGAGVFAAFGPAAEAAGAGLLLGLALAGAVALCNAVSSARLAAVYPESGGTYVYGRERLGPFFGYLAGFGFVVGKIASLTAMALTFGLYALPAHARPLGIAAVAALTAVNLLGVTKTAGLTRAIVAGVIATLAFVVAASLLAGEPDSARLDPLWPDSGLHGVLASAGFLFFAFAGYARIATFGEEVRDPERTIPRAIVAALAITLALYAAVAASILLVLGADGVAEAAAPLARAVEESGAGGLTHVVRAGAALAALGVILSLLAGVSRTVFAMAAAGDLPRQLAAVHTTRRVPHVAELTVGAAVIVVVSLADLRSAIGFSSVTVLAYYAIANAAAFTLPAGRLARAVPVLGFAGCCTIALALPATTVAAGLGVLAAGALLYAARGSARGTASSAPPGGSRRSAGACRPRRPRRRP